MADALTGAESARAAAAVVVRRHVDAGALASTGLWVWPHHDEQGRSAGFEARHSLVVECPDVRAAADIVTDLATEVGDRLQVEGVTLTTREHPEAGRIARERAWADARARAEHLAGLARVPLGEVVAVADGSGGGGAPGVMGSGPTFRAAAVDVSFEAGEAEIVETLTVTWSLG